MDSVSDKKTDEYLQTAEAAEILGVSQNTLRTWVAADKLRNNLDAAEYKHVVLGLIFLKYISMFEGKYIFELHGLAL